MHHNVPELRVKSNYVVKSSNYDAVHVDGPAGELLIRGEAVNANGSGGPAGLMPSVHLKIPAFLAVPKKATTIYESK